MKGPVWWLLLFEDRIMEFILRRPGFHRFVGRVHRFVEEQKHGRNPDEPLHPGEATELPSRGESFAKHFIDELKKQAKGNPTKDPPSK